MLMAEFEPGTYVLASSVLGAVGNKAQQFWQDVPILINEGKTYTAKYLDKEIKIKL